MALSPPCVHHVRHAGRGRVLVADEVHELLIRLLEACGFSVEYRPGASTEELLRRLGGYDVLVIRGRHRIGREFLDAAASRGLKVIARAGVGLDNIDVGYAERLGIRVVNAPEGPTESVAELTIGLMIAAARRLVETCNAVKSGEWRRVEGVELRGKTLAIIGLGRIGGRVAELARAIGMNVVAYDIADVSERAARIGVRLAGSLHEALAAADVVSLHVPLTPENYHLIGWREFEVMKGGVILVNAARGAVVDPEALLRALDEGIVAVAALDVMETEPPSSEADKRLVRHPRVIVTPHIGAQTREAQERIARILAERIVEAVVAWPRYC